VRHDVDAIIQGYFKIQVTGENRDLIP